VPAVDRDRPKRHSDRFPTITVCRSRGAGHTIQTFRRGAGSARREGVTCDTAYVNRADMQPISRWHHFGRYQQRWVREMVRQLGVPTRWSDLAERFTPSDTRQAISGR